MPVIGLDLSDQQIFDGINAVLPAWILLVVDTKVARHALDCEPDGIRLLSFVYRCVTHCGSVAGQLSSSAPKSPRERRKTTSGWHVK